VNLFFVISAGILLIIFAFFVRVKPIWKNRYRGCDAYYYLLCTEEFRRKRRLPITLPHYFLLDIQEQWYPPGFIVLLSVFPKRFVEKYYWAVSPAVDGLILACLYIITCLVTGNMVAAILAGFLYALTPAVIAQCSSLNSRQLGCFFLITTVLSTFAFVNYHNLYALGACLVFGACLLMTHKMSAQLLYFVLPLMSLVFWNPIYILVMLGIVAATLILSGGLFLKVLKGQYDILRFWNRNWRNLGAHQVYSSPIYGDENRDDSQRVFQKGVKGFYRKIRSLGVNIYVILLVFPLLHHSQLSLFDRQMLWWVILTYVLAILTLLIPRFRFYGEGYKYLRMVAFPISYLAITSLYYGWDVDYYFYPLLAATILASVWIILRVYRFESSASWGNPSMDSNLSKASAFLKTNDKVSVIMSIPVNLADTIAYHCRKRVLWGTHSDNFSAVEPFWPVFRQPLEFFVTEYGVSHIIVTADYVSPELLHLSPDKMLFNAGCYSVYEV